MILFAGQTQTLIAVLGGIAVLVALGAFALFLFRNCESLARRSLRRKYAGLQIHEVPLVGDITLTYHTYHGFLVWFTETLHHVSLPPDHARILLGRLLRFNLTWGLFARGGPLIPPLAVWNYLAQRGSISSQEAENAFAATVAPDASSDAQANPYASPQTGAATDVPSRSLFYSAIGWTCAALCLIFGIVTVTCFVRGEFGPALGGLFVTTILGWTAWTWIGKRSPPSQD